MENVLLLFSINEYEELTLQEARELSLEAANKILEIYKRCCFTINVSCFDMPYYRLEYMIKVQNKTIEMIQKLRSSKITLFSIVKKYNMNN